MRYGGRSASIRFVFVWSQTERPMNDRQKAILAEIPRLRRYARSLMRDADRADDLVQDCLERAFTRMGNWQTGENPRRWLFTIMHNIFIDTVRRDQRRGETMAVAEAENTQTQDADQHEKLVVRDVLDALQKIDPDRRAALILVAVEGFSYTEAADILDVPAGTLMSRIARGRAELRRVLDDNARSKTFRVVE